MKFIAFLLLAATSAATPLCTPAELDKAAMLAKLHAEAPSLAALQPALGSKAYALVDEREVSDLVIEGWSFLRGQGIKMEPFDGRTGWRPRFSCTDLLKALVLVARVRHNREGTSETHPAIFEVAYVKDGRRGTGHHAVAMVFTPKGVLFVDPVEGRINLSPAERNSLYWFVE